MTKPSVAIPLGVEGIMACSLGGQGVPGALPATSLWCTMAEILSGSAEDGVDWVILPLGLRVLNWIPGSRPSLGAWVGVEATDGVFEYGSLSPLGPFK